MLSLELDALRSSRHCDPIEMEKRLYPDLDPFYKFSNVEYGGEDCVPDYPTLDEESPINDNVKHKIDSYDTLLRRVPVTPSAPPLTDTGASLLESLYSFIMEELDPPPYSPNDPLSDTDTWTDDLQPDYDNSIDDVTGVPEINRPSGGENDNNDTTHAENGDNHRAENNVEHSCHRNNGISINNDKGAKNNNQNNMVIVTNRNLEAADQNVVVGRRSKINSEYGAWVTWRKNVNRQLATVILLRKGGHVHLQKSDLSRRPLSRTSMDYVINNARKCNGASSGRGVYAQGTSLNGTPYIMYGIPRVALSKNPPKRD